MALAAILVSEAAAAGTAGGFGAISNARVPPGYFLVPVTTGLDFPTAVAASDRRLWVAEAGVIPGTVPKIKEIAHGEATTILSGESLGDQFLGPLTDVTYHAGWLWVTHRQIGANGWPVGAISKFDPDDPVGTFTTVITNLPSSGDHYTEEIVFDGDGRAYFSQGTATNSSVVGADNFLITGWLGRSPTFHDFAAKDIVLNGRSYQTVVPFPLDPDANQLTVPFMPFGSGPIALGVTIPAATPATPQEGIIAGNGTVYSFDPDDPGPTSTLRLEAWGFRNPYGIGLDPANPSQHPRHRAGRCRAWLPHVGQQVRFCYGPGFQGYRRCIRGGNGFVRSRHRRDRVRRFQDSARRSLR